MMAQEGCFGDVGLMKPLSDMVNRTEFIKSNRGAKKQVNLQNFLTSQLTSFSTKKRVKLQIFLHQVRVRSCCSVFCILLARSTLVIMAI